jgi:hypothetical protein
VQISDYRVRAMMDEEQISKEKSVNELSSLSCIIIINFFVSVYYNFT